MTKQQFLQLVANMREGRNLEFKRSTPWTASDWKAKITKSILGFSNVRDGGSIVVGIKETTEHAFELEGMTEHHFASYKEDDLAAHVATYADPYVKQTVHKVSFDDRHFVVIEIGEFDDVYTAPLE